MHCSVNWKNVMKEVLKNTKISNIKCTMQSMMKYINDNIYFFRSCRRSTVQVRCTEWCCTVLLNDMYCMSQCRLLKATYKCQISVWNITLSFAAMLMTSSFTAFTVCKIVSRNKWSDSMTSSNLNFIRLIWRQCTLTGRSTWTCSSVKKTTWNTWMSTTRWDIEDR